MPDFTFITTNYSLVIAIAVLLGAAVLFLAWRMRRTLGPDVLTYLHCTVLSGLVGFVIWTLTRYQGVTILYSVGMLLMTLSGIGLILGIMEWGILPLLGLLRLGAIAR